MNLNFCLNPEFPFPFILSPDPNTVPEQIPVSAFVPKYGTYLGWPSVVGSNGLELVLPVQLTEEEELKISKCASIIKGASEEILKTL